jgi:outer membrane usher protein
VLEASALPFIIGYDGQAFVDHLKADNRLTVTRTDGTSCVASFAFNPGPKDAIHALDAICR